MLAHANLTWRFLSFSLASGFSAFAFVERNKGSPNEAASWNGKGDCCEYMQTDTTVWRGGLVICLLRATQLLLCHKCINAVACKETFVNC